ncbi:helix-turn-helix domain-containing protein [Haloimpatiens massiliensis]|uniref:helix-turn-helix domain-containing protein n=1 Tax=Haloimpatiens massiliensis TaxID=1658110 RepID=UPI001FA8450C|nr:helix-turn-helix domain-containing protein [Haloimpatiens massiliensis]
MSLAESLFEYEKTIETLKIENQSLKDRVTFLENMIPLTLRNQSLNLELLTVSEVAERLKVNKNSVYELINKGYLKSLKLGSIKVPIEELNNFIERSKECEINL